MNGLNCAWAQGPNAWAQGLNECAQQQSQQNLSTVSALSRSVESESARSQVDVLEQLRAEERWLEAAIWQRINMLRAHDEQQQHQQQ